MTNEEFEALDNELSDIDIHEGYLAMQTLIKKAEHLTLSDLERKTLSWFKESTRRQYEHRVEGELYEA